jgi:hypothetical protein
MNYSCSQSPEAHLSFYSMGTAASISSRIKWPGREDEHSLLLLPNMPSQRGFLINHRHDFTFKIPFKLAFVAGFNE